MILEYLNLHFFFFHGDSIYSIEVSLLELYERDCAHINSIFKKIKTIVFELINLLKYL